MENAANKETIMLEAHLHWSIFVWPVLFTLILLALWKPLCIIGLFGIVYVAIRYATTKLVVSSKRVHGKYGIIQINTIDSPLTKVTDITVQKGILGSIFNYGKIEMRTGGGKFAISGITNPELIRNTILKAADEMEEGRFERQTRRYEEAIREQTMAQMHTGNQIASLLAEGIQEKHGKEKRIPAPASEETLRSIESKPEKKAVEKKTNEKILWADGAPVVVHQAVISPLDEEHVSLKLEIQNLKKIHIEALYFDIQGLDVLKQEKCYLKEIPVLDLDIAEGERQFLPQTLTLPDASIRRVKIYLRHVVFVNEEIWDGSETAFLTQVEDEVEQISRSCDRDIEMLCNEDGLDPAPYLGVNACYPVFRKAYWICACGQFNTEKSCVVCHAEKETIRKILAKQTLIQAHDKRVEEERLEEERRLEEEARMRAEAEEKERLRKEQREEEMRQRIEQVQNLFGTVKNGATKQLQSIKEGAIAQTESLREAVKHETQLAAQENQKQAQPPKEDLPETVKLPETDASVCPDCGLKNDADAVFCVKCGRKLR